MAGEDEAPARAILVEMQRRISQGPHATLGVTSTASPEVVRAGFLELTKVFHPARFGRMSTELQKLSTEVFLGIKAAHETLLRALGVPPRSGAPGQRNQQSGIMPVVTAEGSSKFPVRPGTGQQPPIPRASGTEQPIRNPTPGTPTPTIPRTFTPGTRMPPARPPTPAYGVRVVPMARPTPAQGVRITPIPSGSTPPHGVRAMPAAAPPTDAPARPPTPAAGRSPGPPQSAPVFDEHAERQYALGAIAARNWAAAHQLLNGLVARVPLAKQKQYKALQCYARGREAEDAGRGADAVKEYDRALQLDPDQTHAKTARDELLRRR